MKITLIELDLWCSIATHQSALTSILDFFLSSEVVITWQTDGAAHKLKLRLFHKSTHLWVHSCRLSLLVWTVPDILPLLSISSPLSNFFIVLQENLLALVMKSLLSGSPSMNVFQLSSNRMYPVTTCFLLLY